MRTTLTIDDDLAVRLEQLQRERGLSFKEVVNSTLRAGLTGRRTAKPYRMPTFDMGMPAVDLDKALQLDADLEDEETIRELRLDR